MIGERVKANIRERKLDKLGESWENLIDTIRTAPPIVSHLTNCIRARVCVYVSYNTRENKSCAPIIREYTPFPKTSRSPNKSPPYIADAKRTKLMLYKHARERARRDAIYIHKHACRG